jgi:hypothetical protein
MMTQTTAEPADDFSATEQPVYWFCLLEEAMDRGDLEAAAEAQRELARLGLRVAYDRRGAQRREAVPHE